MREGFEWDPWRAHSQTEQSLDSLFYRGKRAGSKTPTVDYAAGCPVRPTSTKCPTRKSKTSSSPPISRPENAWASRSPFRQSSKSLAKTCKSGLHSLLHLARAAEGRGAGRAAAQALLLCRRLFQTRLPASLTATLHKSVTIRWLEATALRAMTTGQGEHDPHEVRFGTTRGSLSTVLLSRSWRYRLAELRIQLINATDVDALPLPLSLRFLYPVLRLALWLSGIMAGDGRHVLD